ncbi:MAG: PLP-dependent aminotransferase family protein [Anaerolineaceae bacterium]
MDKNQPTHSFALYDQLASEISAQIDRGMYLPGDRLMSVRQARQAKGLSVSTILQAYRLLEDKGLIEARPASGYYVTARPFLSDSLPEPEISSPPLDPASVRTDELMRTILRQSLREDLVQFGTAIPSPDLLPVARLNRIMIRMLRENAYPWATCPAAGGCLEFRQQIARKMARLNCSVPSDEVLVTAGCMEALSLALQAVCKPGDLVAVESPTYFGILQALESAGLQALEIPTHWRDGMSLDALEFAIEHHPVRAVVVVPNFQNPLGGCMPESNKAALVDLLARYEIPLIEDDIYGELAFGDRRPGLAKAFDRDGLVITCSSFTKDIAPSYRVGWMAAGRFHQKVELLKMTLNIGTAILPQLVIAEFLENGRYEAFMRTVRRTYEQRIGYMAQAIQRYFPAGTRLTKPLGGFVLWVQLPEEVDSLVLYEKALHEGIVIAPGYMFSTTDKYRNFIRLNAAYMNFATERAVARLGVLAGG